MMAGAGHSRLSPFGNAARLQSQIGRLLQDLRLGWTRSLAQTNRASVTGKTARERGLQDV